MDQTTNHESEAVKKCERAWLVRGNACMGVIDAVVWHRHGEKEKHSEAKTRSKLRLRYDHFPHPHHEDFFFSGAGLYCFLISFKRTSNALPDKRISLVVEDLKGEKGHNHSPTFSFFFALLSTKPA